MIELTPQEKNLILQALDRLFQPGTVQGDLASIEQVLILARSIEAKMIEDDRETKKPPEGG